MRVNKFLSARRIGAVLISACFLLTGCGGNNAAENGNANSNSNSNSGELFGGLENILGGADEEISGPQDRDGDGIADFFPLEDCYDGSSYMNSPLREELSDYELVSNIIPESVNYTGDGTVYFSAKAPDGGEIRFWGYDIEPSTEGIKFNTKGRMVSLDSLGRIYSLDPVVSENSTTDNWYGRFGAYDLTFNMHPGSMDNMVYTRGAKVDVEYYKEYYCSGCFYDLQPYFFGFGTATPNYLPEDYENPGYYVFSQINLIYRPEEEMQPFRGVILNPMNYGCYVEGDTYEQYKEGKFSAYDQIYDFELVGIPDFYEDYLELPMDRFFVWDPIEYGYELSFADYSVGDLKDKDGNVLDKNSVRVESGMTLDVALGGTTYSVPVNVIDTATEGNTLHELQSHIRPEATGDLNVLCIPFSWSDERERATDAVYKEFCKELGRVSDMNGNVQDYSDSASMKRFSLSEYMDIASYGKFNVTTYMTDWYPCQYSFEEMREQTGDFIYWDIYEWLKSTYPDQDWNKFDLDGDHYFDSVIFLNDGDTSGNDGFSIMSFEGAVYTSTTYGANEYFFEGDVLPAFNSVVYCHSDHFYNSTLIHEFSHNLGLIDYYDVTYSGIDAVGKYDMQSSQYGDWNAFSKYAVGWIEPTIVKGLEPGESAEYTISPMSSSGDAIAIPAAGEDMNTPFDEYILVDLFANVGTHKYDAKAFGLENTVGVQIYHVDARMEFRNFLNDRYSKEVVPIGTPHYGNDYKESGRYQLEVIQAGKANTFTTPGSRVELNSSDFFKAGNTFTMNDYSAFFDGGKFDTGKDFGYSVEIVSITGTGEDAKAVIKITRQ